MQENESGRNPRVESFPAGFLRPNPIHADPAFQSIDIRLYFPADQDHDDIIDDISSVLSDAMTGDLAGMVAAYELVFSESADFRQTIPADKPIA